MLICLILPQKKVGKPGDQFSLVRKCADRLPTKIEMAMGQAIPLQGKTSSPGSIQDGGTHAEAIRILAGHVPGLQLVLSDYLNMKIELAYCTICW
jgi:hypothetical protein